MGNYQKSTKGHIISEAIFVFCILPKTGRKTSALVSRANFWKYFVRFLKELKPRKIASEIIWPLQFSWFYLLKVSFHGFCFLPCTKIIPTLVYRIEVHAHLWILNKKSPLHSLILVFMFINFEKTYALACLLVHSIFHCCNFYTSKIVIGNERKAVSKTSIGQKYEHN